jgi:hypothetical protein
MPDLALADSEKLYVDWNDARFNSEAQAALNTYCNYVLSLKAKATGLIATSAGYCKKLQ